MVEFVGSPLDEKQGANERRRYVEALDDLGGAASQALDRLEAFLHARGHLLPPRAPGGAPSPTTPAS